MNKIQILIHPSDMDVEIEKIPSQYNKKGIVYVMSKGITIDELFKELKEEINVLKKRYRYLERSRNWILKNFRSENGRN